MRRTREFDAFGPWIDVVREPEDVPRLFRPAGLDPTSTDLVLKVPRRISRRDANPDMDLYDHLVAVDTERITLLTRRGGEYTTRQVRHAELAAVHVGVDLLDGYVRLAATRDDDGQPLTFRYNSVSHELVEQLVRLLRARAHGRDPVGRSGDARRGEARPAWGEPVPLGLRDLGDDDVALVTLQRDLTAQEPDLVPVATHRRRVVARRDGTLAGVLDKVRPVTQHAVVVMTGPAELHVLHRRRWFSTGRGPVTSVAVTVVLTDRVTGLAVRASERYQEVEMTRIASGAAETVMPLPEGSATAAAVRGVVEAGRRRA